MLKFYVIETVERCLVVPRDSAGIVQEQTRTACVDDDLITSNQLTRSSLTRNPSRCGRSVQIHRVGLRPVTPGDSGRSTL